MPFGLKSVYEMLRLVATALKVDMEPQPNSIIGGRPLFAPEAKAWLTSMSLKRRFVIVRTSPCAPSESSKSRSRLSSRALPPPNCAVGRPAPTTGLTSHLLVFLISYWVGLNQHSSLPLSPSIWR